MVYFEIGENTLCSKYNIIKTWQKCKSALTSKFKRVGHEVNPGIYHEVGLGRIAQNIKHYHRFFFSGVWKCGDQPGQLLELEVLNILFKPPIVCCVPE